jgi:hypothetical protein
MNKWPVLGRRQERLNGGFWVVTLFPNLAFRGHCASSHSVPWNAKRQRLRAYFSTSDISKVASGVIGKRICLSN